MLRICTSHYTCTNKFALESEIMKKALIGLTALLALSASAVAGDFAETLHYPSAPRADTVKLDNSTTGSIKTGTADKNQSAPSRVLLPVDNLR